MLNVAEVDEVLATALHPSQLDGFTAGAWLNSSRANFVDHNEHTDLDAVSTGCAASGAPDAGTT